MYRLTGIYWRRIHQNVILPTTRRDLVTCRPNSLFPLLWQKGRRNRAANSSNRDSAGRRSSILFPQGREEVSAEALPRRRGPERLEELVGRFALADGSVALAGRRAARQACPAGCEESLQDGSMLGRRDGPGGRRYRVLGTAQKETADQVRGRGLTRSRCWISS